MTNKNIKVGFIGLGIMGFHMAGHLLKNNFHLNILRRNFKGEKHLLHPAQRANLSFGIAVLGHLKHLGASLILEFGRKIN